ncbi:MAG TPA: serine hydrolase domain-containing protein [Chitinophagaceae bacterium]|nr:serine hydrolase domain-containing protein [Chitinophagaceae bacterium]
MKRKSSHLVSLSLSALFTIQVCSQSLPDSVITKVDTLFNEWNNANSPGCSVGIVLGDSLVYAKGFGMANLEHGTRNSPRSIFYMCSVSKQFVGYSIILLARQKIINLDEDIHSYLPWVPDFHKKITVKNLLNHTSGIRDAEEMAPVSGLGDDGLISHELALNILKRQRTLNFNPGEKFSYSNSNYILLAEIVKQVSGKTLRAFADSAIFKPLGMTNSFFNDNNNQLIKNRAESYSTTDNIDYQNSFKNVTTLGAGGLYCNVIDMSKWIMNFYKPKAGDSKDIEQLAMKGELGNGKKIQYASGIIVDEYKGSRRFSHSGGLAGYCIDVSVFPNLKIGFIVFSNQGDFFSAFNKINQLADLFITRSPSVAKNSDVLFTDRQDITRYTGDYLSDDGLQLSFRTENDQLSTNVYGFPFRLSRTDSSSFFADPDLKFSFQTDSRGNKFVLATFFKDENHLLKKYNIDSAYSIKEIHDYIGTYYCPELNCSYEIILKNHDLFLTSNKYNDTKLTIVDKDHLLNDYWWMRHLMVLRNKKNQVIGFEINSERVMHLRFDKIK